MIINVHIIGMMTNIIGIMTGILGMMTKFKLRSEMVKVVPK